MTRKLTLLFVLAFLLTPLTAFAQFEQFGKNNVRYNQLDQFYESYRFDVWHNLNLNDPAQAESLRWVVENLENAHNWMSGKSVYGHTIEKRIPILLCDTHSCLESLNLVGGFLPEGVGAFAESERRRMALKMDFSKPLSRAIGVHELAHEFQFDISNQGLIDRVVSMNSQRPGWFYEGGAEFIAGLYDPHTRDDIRRRNQRIAASDKHLVPTWETLNQGSANPYAMGAMLFEFLEDKFKAGVLLQVEGLKQNDVGLGELIYDLTKGELGNPDINSDKFNQELRRYWNEKYQLEAIERPKPYNENDNFKGRSITPYGNLYPILSPALSLDGKKFAALTIGEYVVSLVVFTIPQEEIYVPKDNRQKSKNDKEAFHHNGTEKLVVNLTPYLPPIPWEYLVSQGLETWPFNGFDVSWSRDGKMLAIFARINRDHALVLLDAETGKILKKIEMPLNQAFSPSFSPNNSVVFSAAQNTTRDIYGMQLDGSGLINLTEDDRFDTAPSFSPDGKKVIYVGSDGDFQHLFMLDLNSRDKKQLTFGRFNDSSPSWSDDGSIIVYTSDEADGIWNIYTLELDTRIVRQWTEFFGGVETPIFARNSKDTVYHVAYVDDDQYRGQIHENFKVFEAKLKKPIREYTVQESVPAGKFVFNPTRDLFKFELDENQLLNLRKPPERWSCQGGDITFGASTYWGMFGQSFIGCSNLLETKEHVGAFLSQGDFRLFDYHYANKEKRTTWVWGAHHFQMPLYYQHYDVVKKYPNQQILNATWVKELSFDLSLGRPLNKFNRLEFYSKLRHRSFNILGAPANVEGEQLLESSPEFFTDLDIQTYRFLRNSAGSNLSFGTAYVRDTVLSSGNTWGPFHGNAFRAQVEFAPSAGEEFQGYVSANVAARTYRHFGSSSLFAGRVELMANSKANGNFMLLCGPEYGRGCEYGSMIGNQVGYASAELRFPIPGTYVLGTPVRGFIFADAALARFNDERFSAQKLKTYGFGAQYIIPFMGLPAQSVWTRDNGKWKPTFYITLHW